jgi:hypothetical protein
MLTIVKKDIRDIEPSDLEGVYAVCDLAALSNDPSGDLDPELTVAINHAGRVRVGRVAKRAGMAPLHIVPDSPDDAANLRASATIRG